MIALIASFFSLCVGPLVYQTFGPLRRTDKIVSGIVLIVVAGIIVFEVIPQTYQIIGWLSLLVGAIGFAGPTLIEKAFRHAADTTHKVTIYLGISGLLVHALLDGAALQTDQGNQASGLTLAIILHRVPVGLTIWWLLKPLIGERYALVSLLLMGLTTVAGFMLNQMISNYHDNYFFALVQALIAGSLLHVAIHKPHSDGCMHTSESHHNHVPPKPSKTHSIKNFLLRWESLGVVIGLLILAIVHSQH